MSDGPTSPPSLAGAAWLADPRLARLFGAIERDGDTAWVVGGAVRNALLGMPVADVDVATTALPDAVMSRAAAAGLKPVPTGIDHGTVTVIAEGAAHEVTTFRRDVETDGRRAVVAYADTLQEDAARRDFSMNALYADAAGNVTDPVGGIPDLRARRIRFVGLPEDRVREDYLRILRFFRFHAWFGDPATGMDPEALAAIAANAGGIDTLSKERIGHEMRRLLAAPDPAPALAAMAASGILGRVLPGADPRLIAPLVHLDRAEPRWLCRLAALGGDDPAQHLRLSRAEQRDMAQIREAMAGGAGPAELAYRHGPQIARDAVLIRAAAGQPQPAGWEAAIATGAAAVLPVKAADLAPTYSGAELGRRLAGIEDRWIASGFSLSREQLLA